jgi:hypothetical protein
MTLQPSQRRGPYEILTAVAARGTGEEHTARNTDLGPLVGARKEAWQ